VGIRGERQVLATNRPFIKLLSLLSTFKVVSRTVTVSNGEDTHFTTDEGHLRFNFCILSAM